MTDNLPVNTPGPKGIDIADIIEYRKKGLTCEEIGILTGCSKQAVSERLRNADLEGLETYSNHKDKVFEHLQRNTIKDLSADDLKKMNPLQRITAAAILQDKIAAMRGQATNITEVRNITIDLSKAYEAMRASQGNTQGNTVDIPVDNSTYQPPDVPVR